MGKVKVSREVSDFLNSFKKKHMSECEDWKLKLIIMHGCQLEMWFNYCADFAKCMGDLSMLDLSKILYNGWEVEKYEVENLPHRFELIGSDKSTYTAVVYADLEFINLIWIDKYGTLNSRLLTIKELLDNLNYGAWIITNILDK